VLFITLQPCRLYETEKLENSLVLMALIKNKYLLHIINKIKKIVGLFIDFLYIYICREMIIPHKTNSRKHSKDRTLWS